MLPSENQRGKYNSIDAGKVRGLAVDAEIVRSVVAPTESERGVIAREVRIPEVAFSYRALYLKSSKLLPE